MAKHDPDTSWRYSTVGHSRTVKERAHRKLKKWSFFDKKRGLSSDETMPEWEEVRFINV